MSSSICINDAIYADVYREKVSERQRVARKEVEFKKEGKGY